jgi:hypothetical protein
MMRIALAIVALLPEFACAQTPLDWKFKEGDAFVYERIAKDEQAIVAKGQTLKQDIRSTWVYRFDVGRASAESATLRVTIEQVAIQHLAGATNTDNKLLEKLKGGVLTATVSTRGEIVALDGYDKLIERIADKRDGLAKAMRQRLPETLMRQELQDILAILPKEPAISGTRWQRTGSNVPVPPLGQFLATVSGVHRDVDRAGHHRLEGDLTGKYQPPEPNDVVRVAAGALSLNNGHWSCVFDNERGRAMSQKLTLELRGEMTVAFVGQESTVEVAIRREVTTRLLPRGKE